MQDAPPPDPAVLDNPVWESLHSGHTSLALRRGRAARYPDDVSPFASLPLDADDRDWHDLAALTAGRPAVLFAVPDHVPTAAEVVWSLPGVQLVDAGVDASDDPEAVELGTADVPDLLDLTRRTEPGPFLPRTVELGTYLGLRRDGRLAALAGQRMRPPGWAEISAVCTDPDFRGQGLASRLVSAVVARTRAEGRATLLHASADNTGAIRLYRALGFELRREFTITVFRLPHG
ncbi:GNAT family N-acetyltransferase [Kineococcus sp. NUM-3379]